MLHTKSSISYLGREDRKKKRKSRWGGEDKKMIIPGMPTTLPPNLKPDQQKAYLMQLRIEEISRMLRTGDLGIPDNPEDRGNTLKNMEKETNAKIMIRGKGSIKDGKGSFKTLLFSC
ncbi:predicted protein [Nematostella vectensis]|uniref:Branchpoint-bridging protein n=1 Tax=Nematostella vectensis TaxID=45351 RepID=A7T8Z1_NEMVE|nr:predicted protein [Nematostella vectensis]|eukprot:XP_001619643.1 hypothetical protein NEMVEDRAFT_v1g223981 [Nematostella vectensis]